MSIVAALFSRSALFETLILTALSVLVVVTVTVGLTSAREGLRDLDRERDAAAVNFCAIQHGTAFQAVRSREYICACPPSFLACKSPKFTDL